MLDDTDLSESAPCCKIPLERAEALVVELEEAGLLVDQLAQVVASERARCERIYNVLAKLLGEERAARIAEGEELYPLLPRDALASRTRRPRAVCSGRPRGLSANVAGLSLGIALPD